MSAKKYVSYLVGTILSFPIYVYHLLPINQEQKKKKKTDFPPSANIPAHPHSTQENPQYSSKRTCGHSQKSVRENHKRG